MPSTPESPRVAEAVVSRTADGERSGRGSIGTVYAASVKSLGSGLDHSSIMGAELIAGFLTWAGIGWLLDRWLGTGPWLLVVGALVGNAAGIYLIALRSARMEGYDGKPGRFDAPAAGHVPADVVAAPAVATPVAVGADGPVLEADEGGPGER